MTSPNPLTQQRLDQGFAPGTDSRIWELISRITTKRRDAK